MQPSTDDVAHMLKMWRGQEGLSQSEAAAHLGVSVRTLQGWELGRPMPYPRILRSALLNTNAGVVIKSDAENSI
jgi:DNA-binding transcriptional regulator YiaG